MLTDKLAQKNIPEQLQEEAVRNLRGWCLLDCAAHTVCSDPGVRDMCCPYGHTQENNAQGLKEE